MPDDSQLPASGGQRYTGPERRRFDRSMLLSDADVRLLVLAERGHTFRPEDAAEGLFDVLIDNLISLRDRGLLRLDDGRIMMSGLRWCPAYAIAARSSLFGLLESASAVA